MSERFRASSSSRALSICRFRLNLTRIPLIRWWNRSEWSQVEDDVVFEDVVFEDAVETVVLFVVTAAAAVLVIPSFLSFLYCVLVVAYLESVLDELTSVRDEATPAFEESFPLDVGFSDRDANLVAV